jgi:hypothetical protein
MKKLILKHMTPFAVAILGISGAFFTTSMKGLPDSALPRVGYTLNAAGNCDVAVECDTNPINPICRLNGDSGPQAFAKNAAGKCNQIVYRP